MGLFDWLKSNSPTLQSLVSSAEFDQSRVFVTYSRDLEGRTANSGMDESVKVFMIVGERHQLA